MSAFLLAATRRTTGAVVRRTVMGIARFSVMRTRTPVVACEVNTATFSTFITPTTGTNHMHSQRCNHHQNQHCACFSTAMHQEEQQEETDFAIDLPPNLIIDEFEDLVDETEVDPEYVYDEAELLRADNSEKLMDVVTLTTRPEDLQLVAAQRKYFEENPLHQHRNPNKRPKKSKLDLIQTPDPWDGGPVMLDNRVFGVPIRRDIVHRVVVWQRANWRQGTAHTKTRSEVSGGGKKPWRQKGTGRARHGSTRSPIWRGGGKAHGKKKRDFSFKLNKKVRRMGMRVALAAKWREGNLILADLSGVRSHKTKHLLNAFKDQGIEEEDGSILFIEDDEDNNEFFKIAASNLPWTSLYTQKGADVYKILKHHRLVITPQALSALTERVLPF